MPHPCSLMKVCTFGYFDVNLSSPAVLSFWFCLPRPPDLSVFVVGDQWVLNIMSDRKL